MQVLITSVNTTEVKFVSDYKFTTKINVPVHWTFQPAATHKFMLAIILTG